MNAYVEENENIDLKDVYLNRTKEYLGYILEHKPDGAYIEVDFDNLEHFMNSFTRNYFNGSPSGIEIVY
jgi:hypothetical protein